MKTIRYAALCLGFWLALGSARGEGPPRGYRKKVQVSAPTRLDWTFALATQSLARPPADWLPGYDSTKQQYDLFVPADYQPKQAYPLVVFLSPGAQPMGWKHWEPVCKQHDVLFAEAYDAGNDCPPKQRVRIVLDVLDDVRRHYRTDVDRTYLGGFSGGGRIACALAFALPEHFGGVVPVCAAGELREEAWLQQRVRDRLSVALVTGETDFNRGEVERYRGPFLQGVGVRAKVWTCPKMGHALPSGQQLQEVFRWLEEGVGRRRELAKRYPASHIAGDAAPTREEWSKSLLAEAEQRLGAKETLYSGLMQLQGCMHRWDGLPAAAKAKKTLLEYDARKERPWEADDVADQRRFLLAKARALDAYASGPLPPQYVKMREDMAKQALELWETILKDGPDTPPGQEARRRTAELRKLIDGKAGKD